LAAGATRSAGRSVPGGGGWRKPLPPDPDAVAAQAVRLLERHSGAALARLLRFMGMETLEWEARGAVVRDVHGNEYVDCGGYGTFFHGHSHPRVVEAVCRQAAELALSTRLLPNAPQAELSARLAAVCPPGLQYSFFCNSGAEAVEGALKLARLRTGRRAVLAAEGAFHGKTYGALSATGKDMYRDPFAPLVPDFHHVPFGDAEALARRAAELAAAPGGLAAVILEPIQGEAGVILPPPGYLRAVREVCDRHGALLVLDEVQTGIGRTGAMFACQAEGVAPDILCVAKSLGGGVMPLGAFVATADAWQPLDEAPFLHTSTFGGNPLACAAGLAALEAIEEEDLLGRSRALGERLGRGLGEIARRYPEAIAEVRGRGLLWGLDLRGEGLGGMLLSRLLEAGVLVVYSLNQPRVVRVMPPAVATPAQIDFVLEAVDAAVREVAAVAAELRDPPGTS
jgi:putrescine aminotransferase